ncbi:virion structural protein [Sinorhizobium phage ort11]|uniref:Uncharacterized protein n=1 Tax=Sinorhizobium phage ort11 TaxID=2599764 RepID=A0A5C2H6H0_9CAUD|nr:virion structural protein [Sinorhizobium phage ort11]QEP29883.1 hypothetical protein Smphiort11_085 [Sinorhizobium phage ort11]
MNLLKLFERLALGELSNLSISQEGVAIAEKDYPKLVNYTNEGLEKLYTRFILKEKALLIEQHSYITNYHLIPRYSQSMGQNPKDVKYILDQHCASFTGDLIKILEVYDVNGCKRVLNDAECYESLFTPQPHTLQVPNPVQGEPLNVTYQAAHKKLLVADLKYEIEIPSYMEMLLQFYVAYKVYCNMNGQENNAKGQEYLASYETGCLEIENKDLVNGTISTTNTKFHKRGWV